MNIMLMIRMHDDDDKIKRIMKIREAFKKKNPKKFGNFPNFPDPPPHFWMNQAISNLFPKLLEKTLKYSKKSLDLGF